MPSQQHPELFVQPLILSIKVASSTWKAWEAMPELGDGERPCHCHRGQLQVHARGGRGCSLVGIAAGEWRLSPICAAAMNLALVAATGELEISHLLG